MRRIIRVLLLMLAMLLLCSPALSEDALRGYTKKDGYVYLTLGTYPQTADGQRQPILWRVLEAKDGKAYLLSEYVLEARRIHGDYQAYANKPSNKKKPGFHGDFPQTELGRYLNGDFAANNFTPGELALVVQDETLGQFTLVTGDDLKNKNYGFTSNESRKAWGTAYATTYVHTYTEPEAGPGDDLFVYGSKYGNHSPYWTRTQSTSDARHARCTKQKGDIGRINVITVDLGMRPACWLDLSLTQIASGTGAMNDPFVLVTEPETIPAES